MPKKYIDAKDARTVLEKLIMSAGSVFDQQLAYDSLDSIPAADVEEVKHGKWIDKGHFSLLCDKCEAYVAKGLLLNDQIYYCPRCGAKMDRKEKRNEKERHTHSRRPAERGKQETEGSP